MATRVYAYAESLGAATNNTTATPADACTLTFTPDASSTYAIFCSAEHSQQTNTTTESKARLYHSTASTVLTESYREPQSTSPIEWVPISGCIPVAFGGSPGSQTFKLQYFNETGTAITSMRNAKIFAIKLGANDLSAVDLSTTTVSDGTLTDKLTWTAPATGTFDLFFSETLNSSNAFGNHDFQITLADGATVRDFANMPTNDVDDLSNLAAHLRLSCTSGDVIRLQYRRGGSGTTSSRYAAIVGFRTSGFNNTYNAEDHSPSTYRTTTSTSYVERNAASTLTYTPAAAADHFMFGSSSLDRYFSHFNAAAMKAELPVSDVYTEVAYSGDGPGTCLLYLAIRRYTDLPVASTVQKWWMKSVAAGTTDSKDATMGAWELEDTIVDTPLTPVKLALTTTTFAPTVAVSIHNAGLLEDLVDDFSGTLGQWSVGSSGATIVSGHLDLPYSSGVTKTIASADLWDAEGSRILVRMSDVLDTGQVGMRLLDGFDATNYIDFYVATGTLKARISHSGTTSTTTIAPYSAANHAWWQIAKAAATWVLYVSPSGIDASWSPVASFPTVWTADNVLAEFWTIGA